MCYAEKTHGSYILPYISTTRSPQQMMGALVKDYFATRINCSPAQIYHVTVMPCFDKKLEASRSDFYSDVYHTRDVDCVITSGNFVCIDIFFSIIVTLLIFCIFCFDRFTSVTHKNEGDKCSVLKFYPEKFPWMVLR